MTTHDDPPPGAQFDAVVVGAGIIGASIACRLAQAGMRVAILDAGRSGSGVSSTSFAWANAEQKEPDAYHRLNVAGMQEYDALERDVPGARVYRSGAIRFPSSSDEDGALERRRERLQRLGHSARWIDRDEAQQREPQVEFPAAASRVLLYEDDLWIDPPQVIDALLASSGEAITVFEHFRVTGLRHTGGRITAVVGSDLIVGCDRIVVAAGVGTSAIAALAGAHVPVDRVPGLVVTSTPVPPDTLRGIALERTMDIRPDPTGGICLVGGTALPEGAPTSAVDEEARRLLERARRFIPALAAAEVAAAHVGIRPIPADGLTIAGRLPGVENAWVAVTHSGVTLGPLLGRLIASEMSGSVPDPLLADFRPERFASR